MVTHMKTMDHMKTTYHMKPNRSHGNNRSYENSRSYENATDHIKQYVIDRHTKDTMELHEVFPNANLSL